MTAPDGKKEACKTYLEQTKLLVTLASAFIFAPPGLVAILKEKPSVKFGQDELYWLIAAEVLFLCSVLAGYVAIAALAGSQDVGRYDVYRPAVRWASLIQFLAYLFGVAVFIWLAVRLVGS